LDIGSVFLQGLSLSQKIKIARLILSYVKGFGGDSPIFYKS
jgi:hypothetical protein